MREIIESTLVSADGVVGSPPLWAMEYRDEEVTRDALERLSGCDAMLDGPRQLRAVRGDLAHPDGTTSPSGSTRSANMSFSSTLDRADWSNSTIVRGDVLTEVAKIKERDGRAHSRCSATARSAQTLLETPGRPRRSSARASTRSSAGAELAQFRNGQQDAADAGLGQVIQDRRRDPLLPGQRSRT